MTATPPMAYQLKDGGRCPSKDCACSAARMYAYRASMGRWDLKETTIRAQTGISCSTGTGGVPYGPLAAAIEELTRGEVRADVYTSRTWKQVRSILRGGSPVILSGLYKVLQGTGYECDDDFLGGHAFLLNQYHSIANKPDTVQVGDPLADGRYDYRRGWVDMPQKLVAELGERRNGGSSGSASITIVSGADTEDVERVARTPAVVQASARLDARNLRKLVKGRRYGTRRSLNGGQWTNDLTGAKATLWWELDGGGFVPGEALVLP